MLQRLLLGGFVLSLFFPAWALFAVGVSGVQISFLFLVLVYAHRGTEIVRGRLRLQHQWSHLWLLGLIIIATALILRAPAAPSWGASQDPLAKTLRQLVYLYAGGATFLIVPYLVRTKSDVGWVAQMLMLGGWLAVAYSIGEIALYFGLAPWFEPIDQMVRSNPSYIMAKTETLFGFIPRLHIFASEPSLANVLLLLPFSLATSFLLLGSTGGRNRYAALVFSLLGCYLFSFSRIGAAALIVVCAIIALATFSAHDSARRGLTALFALVLGLSVLAIALSSIGRGPETPLLFTGDSSIYTRIVTQILALRVWGENIQGIGWGLFGYYFQTSAAPYLVQNAVELYTMVFENPRGWVPIHNTYLRIGVELGVEGLVLFGLLVWASVSNSFRAIKLRAADSQCVVLVAVSAALAGILVVGILADLAALSMFWFLLAFAERSATISLVRATAA
jgi:hypothetical protein